jgi:hypothetical protein
MDIAEECGWDSLEGIDVQGRFSKPFKSLNRVRPRILGVSSSFGPVRVPLFGVSDTNQGSHS